MKHFVKQTLVYVVCRYKKKVFNRYVVLPSTSSSSSSYISVLLLFDNLLLFTDDVIVVVVVVVVVVVILFAVMLLFTDAVTVHRSGYRCSCSSISSSTGSCYVLSLLCCSSSAYWFE